MYVSTLSLWDRDRIVVEIVCLDQKSQFGKLVVKRIAFSFNLHDRRRMFGRQCVKLMSKLKELQ
jgi:hypothetical protein